MKSIQWFIATFGGVGYAPISGTAGSIAAAAVWWFVPWNPLEQAIACVVVILLGIWASQAVALRAKDEDPSIVVIDEVAGMWLALWALPKTWVMLGLALVFFRIFDIIKPPPIRQIESLPGGWGIVLDDVAAGVLARIVVGLIATLFFR